MTQETSAHGDLDSIIGTARTQYRTVSDMVTSVLREGILKAAFRPGERLRQDELARQLEVSRMPVRSALLQLESEGLVTFHPHRGAIVARLDTSKVREIYEIRRLLESLALERSIQRMTEERLLQLHVLAERLDGLQDGDDFLALRLEFYERLYDREGNPMLVALIQRLRGDVGRYWLRLRVAEDHDHASSHQKLLLLVEKGDPAAAQTYLREHLVRVENRLCELMDAPGA